VGEEAEDEDEEKDEDEDEGEGKDEDEDEDDGNEVNDEAELFMTTGEKLESIPQSATRHNQSNHQRTAQSETFWLALRVHTISCFWVLPSQREKSFERFVFKLFWRLFLANQSN